MKEAQNQLNNMVLHVPATQFDAEGVANYVDSLNGLSLAQKKAVVNTSALNETQKSQVVTMLESKAAIKENAVATQQDITTRRLHTAMTKAQTVAQKALNTALQIGKALLKSMIITAVITVVLELIQQITDACNAAAKAEQELIDKSYEARDALKSIVSEFKDTEKQVKKLAKTYAELAQEVDGLGTLKQSPGTLSLEEYDEFLEIGNELAALFPELKIGIDDNGNALLNLSGNVDTITGSLYKLLEVEQRIANQEILKEADSAYKTWSSESFKYVKSHEGAYDDDVKVVQSGGTHTSYLAPDGEYEALFEEAGLNIEDYRKKGRFHNYAEWYLLRDKYTYDFSQMSDADKQKIAEAAEKLRQEIVSSNERKDHQNAVHNAEAEVWFDAWLDDETLYKQLSQDSPELAQIIRQVMHDAIDTIPVHANDFSGAIDWMEENILDVIDGIDNEQILSRLTDVFNGELTAQGIQNVIDNLLNTEGLKSSNPLIKYLNNKLTERQDYENYYDAAVSEYGDNSKQKLEKFFKDNSIDTTAEIDYWHKVTDGINNADAAMKKWLQDKVNNSKLGIAETVGNVEKKLKPVIDSLASAYQKIFSAEGFDLEEVGVDMLASVKSAIEEINKISGIDIKTKVYEDFAAALVDPNANQESVQNAFNDLVTDIIRATDTAEFNSENYEVLVQMLEELGVTNAEETLGSIKNIQDQLIKQGKDLANMTADEVVQFYNEAKASGAAAKYLQAYALQKELADNPLNTDEDIQELKNLSVALGLTSEMASALANIEQGQSFIDLAKKTGGLGPGVAAGEALIKSGKEKIQKLIDEGFTFEFDWDGLIAGGNEKEALKKKFDWIETFFTRLQTKIDRLGTTINAAFKPFTERKSAINETIKLLEKEKTEQWNAKNKYEAEANNVAASYNTIGASRKAEIINLIKNGSMTAGVKSGYSSEEQKFISEYQEMWDKAEAAETRYGQIESDIVDKYQERYDLVASEYDIKLGLYEHEADMLNGQIDQAESMGYMVDVGFYQRMKEIEEGNLSTLRKKRTDLQKEFDKAVANGLKEGTEEWDEWIQKIRESDKDIQSSITSIEELVKKSEELEWDKFDKKQDFVGQVHDEKDFLLQLLEDEDKFDDNGNWTEYADATAGLHAMGYNTYMEQAKANAKELADLDKEYANDKYNETYLERRQTLLAQQRENILAAKDEKQAMIELAEEGFNAMLEALDELIEKRKEALDAEKDLYDFQKNVLEQTKNIASLEKQLASYSEDDSEEAKAKVQQLQVSLDEARQELEETEYDRWKQDQEKMLDELANDAQEWVNERLDKEEELLTSILNAVNGDSNSILNTLNTLAKNVGASVSTNMSDVFNGKGSIMENVQSTLTNIYQYVEIMAKESLRKTPYAQTDIDRVNDIINKKTKATSFDHNRYDLNDDGKLTAADLELIKKKYKGYATGSRKIKHDELAWTQENGLELIYRPSDGAMLTPLEADGVVFTAEMTRRLYDFASNPEMFSGLTSVSLPKGLVGSGMNNSVQNDVVMNISLPNVVDVDGFVNELRTNKKFEKVVQSMTIGNIASGSNSLSKFKY